MFPVGRRIATGRGQHGRADGSPRRMSQQWARLPERGNLLALRLIRWIALHIGRSTGRVLLYPITLYFLMTATAARRGSRRFLRRALDREPGWRDLFRHIHCFAATILDRVYFLTGNLDRFEIEIFGDQILLDQVASGRGCILLGSHLGSFEALRALGVTLRHLPIRVLMNIEHNRAMTRILDALNPELARAVIPIGRPETLLQVQESVAQGCMVGALGDRIGGHLRHCLFRRHVGEVGDGSKFVTLVRHAVNGVRRRSKLVNYF